MIATFLKRFRRSFISLLVILAGYAAWACADGYWGDGEDSNYAPEAFVDSAYKPFFYSMMFYYDINYDIDHNKRFNDDNVEDWSGYLGASAKKTELGFLLNQASKGYVDTVALISNGKLKNISAPAYHLDISGKTNDSKTQNFLRYLVYAKNCESFSVKIFDYWDYQKNEETPPKASYAKWYEEMKKEFASSKDEFIKQRYWFQLVRYNYYFNTTAAITLFENNKNSFPKNTIYYRTMAAAAGALYKEKKFAKANYYYSLVFAGNDQLKTVAHWSFHPQDEADWNQTLALCANNEERITLWQMLGIFYKDEMRSMQEIYKLNPRSAKMDVLLTRFINKNENENSFYEEKKNSQENIKNALPWLKQVVQKGDVSNPFLWNTSIGYLYFLVNDFAAAEAYYKKAGNTVPKISIASGQLRLLLLLNQAGSPGGIKSADENRLLPELKWLYTQTDTTTISHFRYREAQRWVKTTLAKKYQLQNDKVKAECFVSSPVFYTNNNNVEQLKALLTKKNKTSYEEFCAFVSEKKIEDCWAFQAIQDAFNDKIDDAIQKMEKAPIDAGVILAGNPFNGRIKDCHDCDHQAPQKIRYSKLSFLQKLKEMEDNIAKGNDVYNNAVLVGNAFYNISHYGNARYFYSSAVLGEGHYSPFTIDSVFVPILTSNSVAKKYYRLALEKATDDEQKAKCNYMIAKCDRNEWYNRNYYNNRDNEYGYDDKVYIDWKIFDELKQYSHTRYYQEVLKECGYFSTYVRKGN